MNRARRTPLAACSTGPTNNAATTAAPTTALTTAAGRANGGAPPHGTRLARWALALLMVAAPLGAAAQDFPSKPVRMVTPFPAGASTDLVARAVAAGMSKVLGQQVVVDVKAGAGGTLAAQEVARAQPDGYTFMLVSAGIVTMNQSIYKKLPYDPIKDFAPLSVAVRMPLMVVANPARPFRTLPELLSHARAHPGQLSYGSSGTGTSQHVAGELFKSMANVYMLHIPYRGGAPAMVDLIGGQLDLMFVQAPSGIPQVKAGKVRALAIGSAKRSRQLPDVPTVAESGVKGYEADTWYGFVMPAGVPPAVGAKLHAAIVAALKEAQPQLEREGFEVEASSQATMASTIRADAEKWAKVIRAAKIEAE